MVLFNLIFLIYRINKDENDDKNSGQHAKGIEINDIFAKGFGRWCWLFFIGQSFKQWEGFINDNLITYKAIKIVYLISEAAPFVFQMTQFFCCDLDVSRLNNGA